MTFHINDACWKAYPQERLFELMESHRFLFPEFERPAGSFTPDYSLVARKDEPYRDDWGCLWETSEDGITGLVTTHPLEDWSAFAGYQPPDPEHGMGIGPVDWEAEREKLGHEKEAGRPAVGGLRHGHTFLQLVDIRGYENLMYDMADADPRLNELIAMLEDFNLAIVRKSLEAGAEIIVYPEDLGMQNGPLVSPAHFRAYIKPSYQRLMAPARVAGAIVHMHSDGYLHELIDDIVEGGVDVINLQDLVNGIDWIAARFAGRTCVELDLDRQSVTASGSPREIDALVGEEVAKVGRREGGVMMIFGLYPGLPMENVGAVMDAMERHAFHFSG